MFDKIKKIKGGMGILVALGFVASFLGGMQTGGEVQTLHVVGDSIQTMVDTVQVETVKYVELPAEVDTMTLTMTEFVQLPGDTIWIEKEVEIPTEVARLDTLLEEGKLSLEYFVTPRYFNLQWEPIPLEVRCRQLVNGTIKIDTGSNVGFYAGLGTSKGWNDGWGATLFLAGQVPGYVVYLETDKHSYSFGLSKKIF